MEIIVIVGLGGLCLGLTIGTTLGAWSYRRRVRRIIHTLDAQSPYRKYFFEL